MFEGLALPIEVVALVASLGIFLLLRGLYALVVRPPVEQRLDAFVSSQRHQQTHLHTETHTQGSLELLNSIERRMARRKLVIDTRMLLVRANLHISAMEFIGLRVGAALLLALLAGIYLFPRGNPLVSGLAAVGAAVAGSYVPVLFAHVRIRRRQAALEAQLPDMLDLITASLQAGAGLAQALEVVVREMPQPVSEEVRRVMREVELGLSLNEALSGMVDRVGSEDLDLVVTAINIQSRIGGNLVQVLRTITQTIRERIRIRGEINVLTATQRLSGWVIGLVPPGLTLVLYLINPKYMGRLFEPGITRVALIVGVIMMIAGVLTMKKITDIEV